MGPCAGYDALMSASVEAGLLEALFLLAQNPRQDGLSIVHRALDTVICLITVGNPTERHSLVERAASCMHWKYVST